MKQSIITLSLIFTTTLLFGQANTKLSNLVSPTAVNQHLLPNSTNTKDLGSSSLAWRNLYLRGDVYLDGTRFVSNHPGTPNFNAFLGSDAGKSVSSAINNTALGHNALYKTTSGSHNTTVGAFSLYNNTTGYSNTAVGVRVLNKNTTGVQNTAVGDSALYLNTTGNINTATGYKALMNNTTGSENNAFGLNALRDNTTGYANNAFGTFSLWHNTTGAYNTAIGKFALYYNTTTSFNTAIGYGAGDFTTNPGSSTFLGASTQAASNLTNVTVVGYNAYGTASNQVMLGNSSVTSVVAAGSYYLYSDGRFKSDIKTDVPGLAFINALKPVTYHYKIRDLNSHMKAGIANAKQRAGEEHGELTAQEAVANPAEEQAIKAKEQKLYTGFVAQDVEAAATKLNYEFSGLYKPSGDKDVYALSYADFVVPLVKAVQELSKENEELKKKAADIEDLMQKNEQLEQRLQKLERLTINSGNTLTYNSGHLEQNTPNPVSGSTTIRYTVPETATSARLTITNAKGQLIKTINLNSKGIGQVRINTASFAAGTYNYSLHVDGRQADTKRLIIAQ